MWSSFIGSVRRRIFWSDISTGAGVGLVAGNVGSRSFCATTGSGPKGSGATSFASPPAGGRATASGARAPLTVAPSEAPAGAGGRTVEADGAMTLASGIRRGALDGSRAVDARGTRATTGGAARSGRRGSSSALGGDVAADGAPEIALASTRKMSGFAAAGSVASFNPNAATMIWSRSEPEVQSGRFEPRRWVLARGYRRYVRGRRGLPPAPVRGVNPNEGSKALVNGSASPARAPTSPPASSETPPSRQACGAAGRRVDSPFVRQGRPAAR